MRIAIVGGGVSGLTCGVRLLEEEGARVTIVSREPPGRTTWGCADEVARLVLGNGAP
ncbi:MAG: hypothetical protein QOH76_1570 [Thermoleophilaceae bacterium]|nr:hypothetical protein [Thermoleophilaceae bacterium]